MDLTDPAVFVFRAKAIELKVRYDKVNVLEYGQHVDRRYALAIVVSPMLLLSKKRQHFLTLGYADDAGKQQAIVLRLHKRSVRPVLAGLEARTGRKVEAQDAEARKSRRG